MMFLFVVVLMALAYFLGVYAEEGGHTGVHVLVFVLGAACWIVWITLYIEHYVIPLFKTL
jgi:hypothetical protein